jgi:hypothetical protein
MWPAVLLLVCGLFFFREAVVASILATPHPALVYVIFAIYAVAIGAAMVVMQGYLHEAKYAKRWIGLTGPMRTAVLEKDKKSSAFSAVYRLLDGHTGLNAAARQSAVAQELESGEVVMEQRLELPNFLGGALVGMGLVGTFVGLLGTLDDLSKVFSALVGTNSKAMTPTQMFTDMVVKLQEPMRGMGTAFVASLYGLLGSLIVTLMMVSVRKTAASCVHHIHKAVRQMGYGAQMNDGLQTQSGASDSAETLQAIKNLQAMIEVIVKRIDAQSADQAVLAKNNAQLIQEMLRISQAMAANQRSAEETLNVQLAALRAVFTQERQHQITAAKGVRHDTQKVIQNTEEVLATLEQNTRSLRTVLKTYTLTRDPQHS